jgi:hypothetical protein
MVHEVAVEVRVRIAKCTVVIVSPAVCGSVDSDGARVLVAGADRDEREAAEDCRRFDAIAHMVVVVRDCVVV